VVVDGIDDESATAAETDQESNAAATTLVFPNINVTPWKAVQVAFVSIVARLEIPIPIPTGLKLLDHLYFSNEFFVARTLLRRANSGLARIAASAGDTDLVNTCSAARFGPYATVSALLSCIEGVKLFCVI
jgi:hypothetical protein